MLEQHTAALRLGKKSEHCHTYACSLAVYGQSNINIIDIYSIFADHCTGDCEVDRVATFASSYYYDATQHGFRAVGQHNAAPK